MATMYDQRLRFHAVAEHTAVTASFDWIGTTDGRHRDTPSSECLGTACTHAVDKFSRADATRAGAFQTLARRSLTRHLHGHDIHLQQLRASEYRQLQRFADRPAAQESVQPVDASNVLGLRGQNYISDS